MEVVTLIHLDQALSHNLNIFKPTTNNSLSLNQAKGFQGDQPVNLSSISPQFRINLDNMQQKARAMARILQSKILAIEDM